MNNRVDIAIDRFGLRNSRINKFKDKSGKHITISEVA
jgi:hypothetical protein